jgi:hypothetical protein
VYDAIFNFAGVPSRILREFFVDTMSTDKIYVLYITSEEMSKRWNAVLEVGAGWITQSSHKIFNILDYDSETPAY